MCRDLGTRRDGTSGINASRTDGEILADLIAQTHFDGFNGDTMRTIPLNFYVASVKRAGDHPIAMEAEGGNNLASFKWTTMGWGYWYALFSMHVRVVACTLNDAHE